MTENKLEEAVSVFKGIVKSFKGIKDAETASLEINKINQKVKEKLLEEERKKA